MAHTLQREKGKGVTAFFLALAMGVLLFAPFVLFDKGYFIYYGDFNAQQIPFYQPVHCLKVNRMNQIIINIIPFKPVQLFA